MMRARADNNLLVSDAKFLKDNGFYDYNLYAFYIQNVTNIDSENSEVIIGLLTKMNDIQALLTFNKSKVLTKLFDNETSATKIARICINTLLSYLYKVGTYLKKAKREEVGENIREATSLYNRILDRNKSNLVMSGDTQISQELQHFKERYSMISSDIVYYLDNLSRSIRGDSR